MGKKLSDDECRLKGMDEHELVVALRKAWNEIRELKEAMAEL